MTVSIKGINQISPDAWQVEWESTEEDPTYYVYVDGVLLEQTSLTRRVFSSRGGGSGVQVEVFDDAASVPTASMSGVITVTWEAIPDAAYYEIQRYVSGDWAAIGRVQSTGVPSYVWVYPGAEDATVYQLRVRGVTATGLEGTAREFTITVVARPVAPTVTYSYEEGVFTITEVASDDRV